jgi:hypothetical protein
VIKTLQKYDINQLGYFIYDNTNSNNTTIRDILKWYGRVGEQNRRRLRRRGHVINLIVQVFLFKNTAEAFKSNNLDDLEAIYKLW